MLIYQYLRKTSYTLHSAAKKKNFQLCTNNYVTNKVEEIEKSTSNKEKSYK